MKKLFALLLVLALMVSVAACSSQELTMQQLIEANQTEALLESYDSICVHTTIAGELYSSYYVTDTYSYENHETWSMYVTDDAGYGYQNGMYTGVVCLTRDSLVDLADYRAGKYADVVMSQESLQEKIQSVDKTENLRTITLVFHVGTEKEKAETVQVPKGLALWLVLPEDVTESFSVYADAACTVPHESNGDYTSDVTVYIK